MRVMISGAASAPLIGRLNPNCMMSSDWFSLLTRDAVFGLNALTLAGFALMAVGLNLAASAPHPSAGGFRADGGGNGAGVRRSFLGRHPPPVK